MEVQKSSDYQSLLNEILSILESKIIQHPSLSHSIHSLKELEILFEAENDWLKLIIGQKLSEAHFDKLEAIGKSLKNRYQVSLWDILGFIDMTSESLLHLSSINKTESIDANILEENIKVVKNSLSKGFFIETLNEFSMHLHNGFMGTNKSMVLHKEWLLKLEKKFLDGDSVLPEMDHTKCKFSSWLDSLDAKLILHASGKHAFDLRGSILLSHRNVHDEATIVNSYLEKSQFSDAVNHFQTLVQEFLLLEKYISEAYFKFYASPYFNFVNFVLSESTHNSLLSYYFVINSGVINQSDIHFKQKKEMMASFTNTLFKILESGNVDFASYADDKALHVLVKDIGGKYANHFEPIKETFDQLMQPSGNNLLEQVRVKLFQLSDIPNCNFEEFDSFLRKITLDKHCADSLCELSVSEVNKLHKEAIKDLKLLESIKLHIEKESFVLHYQPIVDLDGHNHSVESLIRLQTDDKIFEAEDFIGLVDAYKLTLEIDQIVFHLLEKDIPKLSQVTSMINVNIFPQSLSDIAFIQQIVQVGKLCNQNNLSLMVEITERETLMHDQVIKDLHNHYGILFSIDDFGTGYSNLAKLVELADEKVIQQAKLDGELVKNIDSNASKLKIVKFITDMAIDLNLQPVIAEFVDNKTKLSVLSKLPSQILYQGHYFSKAITLDKLLKRG